MRYDEIRQHVQEHFRALLDDYRAGIAADGPPTSKRLDAIRAAQGLTSGQVDDWATLMHPEGQAGVLRAFCELRGINLDV